MKTTWLCGFGMLVFVIATQINLIRPTSRIRLAPGQVNVWKKERFQRKFDSAEPKVMGHEATGVLASVGAAATSGQGW